MEDGNEIKLDKILKAEQMSEGNIYLKEAILELWKENITTFIVGKNEMDNIPFIKFNITNENLYYLYKLYDNCFKYKDFKKFVNGGIQVSIYNEGRQPFMNICVLPKYKDVLYGLLIESVHNLRLQKAEIEERLLKKDDISQVKRTNDVVVCSLHLMNYYSDKGLMVKISATGEKMYIGIGDSMQDFICNDICPTLSNEMNAIKANNDVAHGTYKCDRDSLVNLTNFVYRMSKSSNDKQKSKSN